MTANSKSDQFDLSFKIFHELMQARVQEILLVSSLYDAFIMEEDGRIAGRIIHEYRGLNLTRPPRITWVSSARDALNELETKKFDLVVTMPRLDDMDPYVLCREIKSRFKDLTIYSLDHDTSHLMDTIDFPACPFIDMRFVWLGNTDLLLALIKSTEDKMNVTNDTETAKVRVIILVEDSPLYRSSLLPFIYKEVVRQTQSAMGESLNEEHRILRMRARPKILLAENFEEAVKLAEQYSPFLLSILCDARFPKNGELDKDAGFTLLSGIKKKLPKLPLVLLSSESENIKKAKQIPAVFLNKNSSSLHEEIRDFFIQSLGFGDFVFRMPNGREVGRASNLRKMEKILPRIPGDSIFSHAKQDDFSTWLMARSEIELALSLREVKAEAFSDPREIRSFLFGILRRRRKERQRGVVTDFSFDDFDPEADFVKIGIGSLGGKARGIAFLSSLMKTNPEFQNKYPNLSISIPKTLVISTEGFDDFLLENELKLEQNREIGDDEIEEIFLSSRLPDYIRDDLDLFLKDIDYPLAIRSSSLLEDAQSHPSAGIYRTCMIPNNNQDRGKRLEDLTNAVKMVYASTYFEASRSFARRSQFRTGEDQMAVIIQRIIGDMAGGYYYPALSGVAQSYNFYPVSCMKPEEGIVHMALGFGKTVVEGGVCLRFSPKYPKILPQFSSVENILENSQRYFYALKMSEAITDFSTAREGYLSRLSLEDSVDHPAVKLLSSTYVPEDDRIRDSGSMPGYKVLTFAGILKYGLYPIPQILMDVLEMGRKSMGSPVEIEFAVNLPAEKDRRAEFYLLQIRPMAKRKQGMEVSITDQDRTSAVCFSSQAMGNGSISTIQDIVFVKQESFDPSKTKDMASQISRINSLLHTRGTSYLLIGPGRWGSADPWLGIPVTWKDISGVEVIIETTIDNLKAEPSQGTHFFHNITNLGISYLTIKRNKNDFIDWAWLNSLEHETETSFIKQVRLDKPITVKINGKESRGVIMK